MMTDVELIAEIRSWKGTRWIHGQCVKGVGTDCVRFVCAIGKYAGWVAPDYKVPVYNQDWSLHNTATMLEDEVVKFCNLIYRKNDRNRPEFKVGDIFLFIYAKSASHAGIYIGENTIVHSYRGQGVVESSLRHYWKDFHSAWRPRGGYK